MTVMHEKLREIYNLLNDFYLRNKKFLIKFFQKLKDMDYSLNKMMKQVNKAQFSVKMKVISDQVLLEKGLKMVGHLQQLIKM